MECICHKAKLKTPNWIRAKAIATVATTTTTQSRYITRSVELGELNAILFLGGEGSGDSVTSTFCFGQQWNWVNSLNNYTSKWTYLYAFFPCHKDWPKWIIILQMPYGSVIFYCSFFHMLCIAADASNSLTIVMVSTVNTMHDCYWRRQQRRL